MVEADNEAHAILLDLILIHYPERTLLELLPQVFAYYMIQKNNRAHKRKRRVKLPKDLGLEWMRFS